MQSSSTLFLSIWWHFYSKRIFNSNLCLGWCLQDTICSHASKSAQKVVSHWALCLTVGELQLRLDKWAAMGEWLREWQAGRKENTGILLTKKIHGIWWVLERKASQIYNYIFQKKKKRDTRYFMRRLLWHEQGQRYTIPTRQHHSWVKKKLWRRNALEMKPPWSNSPKCHWALILL